MESKKIFDIQLQINKLQIQLNAEKLKEKLNLQMNQLINKHNASGDVPIIESIKIETSKEQSGV